MKTDCTSIQIVGFALKVLYSDGPPRKVTGTTAMPARRFGERNRVPPIPRNLLDSLILHALAAILAGLVFPRGSGTCLRRERTHAN
jgi:hypothetical protein